MSTQRQGHSLIFVQDNSDFINSSISFNPHGADQSHIFCKASTGRESYFFQMVRVTTKMATFDLFSAKVSFNSYACVWGKA